MAKKVMILETQEVSRGMSIEEVRAAGHSMTPVLDSDTGKTGYVAGLINIADGYQVRLVSEPKKGPSWAAFPSSLSAVKIQ